MFKNGCYVLRGFFLLPIGIRRENCGTPSFHRAEVAYIRNNENSSQADYTSDETSVLDSPLDQIIKSSTGSQRMKNKRSATSTKETGARPKNMLEASCVKTTAVVEFPLSRERSQFIAWKEADLAQLEAELSAMREALSKFVESGAASKL